MQKILSFRDLEVWQLAMDLVVSVYRITGSFPRHEIYGLTAQMRRAAVSIPANIAEGHARRSDAFYLNHLNIALGSQAELLTEIDVASRLEYLDRDTALSFSQQVDRVRQMLHGLRRSLQRRRAIAVTTGALTFLLSSASLFS